MVRILCHCGARFRSMRQLGNHALEQHKDKKVLEQAKQDCKDRKRAERQAHRRRVVAKYPPSVRYAKAKFKKGKKRQRNRKVKLGVQ